MKKLIIALLLMSYVTINFAMDIDIDAKYAKAEDTIDVMKNIVRQRRYISINSPDFRYLLILKKLNKILQMYVPYTFFSLPINEEVMVLAAYEKNVNLMRFLVPRVQNFLNKPGVWDALTHLYFGELPMVALIVQLKSLLMTA